MIKKNPSRHGQISNFLKMRGVTDPDIQRLIILAFGKTIKDKRITRNIVQTNWKQFKQFVDTKTFQNEVQ